MKIIETNGITYLQELGMGGEWYWGTDSACGDLYEAEEVFLKGKRFEPNRLVFVHYPDGKVYEPIPAKENQYFGRPQYVDGKIHILLVNFSDKWIRVLQYVPETEEIVVREYTTGKIVERMQGTAISMPENQHWILR